MRYQTVSDHLLQLEGVRGACSREWQISSTLVMCTELDLAGYSGLAVSPAATMRPRTADPGFLSVTFFRFHRDQVRVWAEPSGVGQTTEHIAIAERQVIERYHEDIRSWVAGDLGSLPPSTSTVVSDRYRNGHTPARGPLSGA